MTMFAFSCSAPQQEDPYIWLEEVEGEGALAWVEEQNRESLAILKGHPTYQEFFEKNLEVLNSSDRIAAPQILGNYIYNFWQDADHVRGIWRRATRESYLKGNPKWDVLLNIDELSGADDVKWVFKGASGLQPDYDRFIVYLSKGGADAVVIREFNPNTKTFIEDGFQLPEAKGSVSWIDENMLMVRTDFGEGSMTTSGYPRQMRIWSRGEDIADAVLIYECETEDMGVYGGVINKVDRQYIYLDRRMGFYHSWKYVIEEGELIKLDVQDDAQLVDILNGQMILNLKSDWEVAGDLYKQGSLVSLDYSDLMEGRHVIRLIVEPGERSSVASTASTQNRLLVMKLTNVISELYSYSFNEGVWEGNRVDVPGMGSIFPGSTDDLSDNFFFYYQNFLTPSSLYYADASTLQFNFVQSMPAFFDASGLDVWQYEVKSSDGTMIPYFVIGSQNMEYNGNNPTLLYAYGGFESPSLPRYSAIVGNSWLEKGGVYVLANIRGGGEFGPQWHQAGLKENRQLVFDDFHAVAEDLIARSITSGSRLGIQGGSNGGLLVGVAFTQRPDLYNAVVCQVPLLDMQRYNKLLAGASWMAEYGDPDIPEEWDFIRKYSPYHNLEEDQDYPVVFFTTSTRDDRVHPGHARKMVAKMKDMGYPVYYYENTEGGHAGASTNEQRAMTTALGYTYLNMKLFD